MHNENKYCKFYLTKHGAIVQKEALFVHINKFPFWRDVLRELLSIVSKYGHETVMRKGYEEGFFYLYYLLGGVYGNSWEGTSRSWHQYLQIGDWEF